MNRKEAVIYLIENTESILKCIGECSYYIWLKGGQIICADEKHSEDIQPFQIHVKRDDSIFGVVRELKKMSFGEAYWHYYNIGGYHDYDIKSIDYDGINYGLEDNCIPLEAYKGFWTIEGVYEDD